MKWIRFFLAFVILWAIGSCSVRKYTLQMPDVTAYQGDIPQVNRHSDSLFSVGDNFLIKDQQQLWQLYVSGDPLQIGLKTGALTEEIYHYQEKAFFAKIDDFVPNGFKQKMLMHILRFYNRNIQNYIPLEYQVEIYGLSRYASSEYGFLGNAFSRNMYLHGAHDIGHAFQDLALVGCTSLALSGSKTSDGGLLIGRNFDFYAGDDFAKNKLISFVKPDRGHAFMSVGWAGFIGVVSGMNVKGLSLTLNAAKSSVPLQAKTPISIVGREILQYASNIDEAIAIAKRQKVFVSESLMIGSAADQKVVLLELTPDSMGVYAMPQSDYLICSNHFQSDVFKSDATNLEQVKNSHSQYRWDKVQQWVTPAQKWDPLQMAQVLRDRSGLSGVRLGMGNEKALNQLLAHHAVIFKPEKGLAWVSASPYQLGEFVAFDLNKIFKGETTFFNTLADSTRNLPRDPFLETQQYTDYENFRKLDRDIDAKLRNKHWISDSLWQDYQRLNPNLWSVYYKRARYGYLRGYDRLAQQQLLLAQQCEVTTSLNSLEIQRLLKKIKRRLK